MVNYRTLYTGNPISTRIRQLGGKIWTYYYMHLYGRIRDTIPQCYSSPEDHVVFHDSRLAEIARSLGFSAAAHGMPAHEVVCMSEKDLTAVLTLLENIEI